MEKSTGENRARNLQQKKLIQIQFAEMKFQPIGLLCTTEFSETESTEFNALIDHQF